MCGIAGIFNYATDKPIENSEVTSLQLALARRGPDGVGLLHEKNVALINTRLSIVDIEGGTQPIFNEDSSAAVVMNGYISNFRELKSQLEARGHVFRTHCDTEVIIHLYEESPVSTDWIRQLNGMFSFAVYNFKNRSLLIARDRYGIKPLYYANLNGQIIFASQLNAINAITKSIEIDRKALGYYLSNLYVPGPYSIDRNVKKLEPGHCLKINNGTIKESIYWDMTFKPESVRIELALEMLEETLKNAVARNVLADVEVGAFLSGGLDSSVISQVMGDLSNSPPKTFTVGFDSQSFDESAIAETTARKMGFNHKTYNLKNEHLPKLINDYALAYDEPFADYSGLSTLFLAENCSSDVKVALGGDGGDEIFGGYPTYYLPKYHNLYRKIPRAIRQGIIKPVVEGIPTSFNRISLDYKMKKFVYGGDSEVQKAYFLWKEVFSAEDKYKLFRNNYSEMIDSEVFSSFEIMKNRFEKSSQPPSSLESMLYVDSKLFLPDDNLCKVDRATMFHGLEARVPFLDNEVVDLLLKMPAQLKVNGTTTKVLLRKLAFKKMPHIARAPKRGFSPPMAEWIRGILKERISDTLLSSTIFNEAVFNRDFISKLLKEHFCKEIDHNRKIWALFALGIWLETRKNQGEKIEWG